MIPTSKPKIARRPQRRHMMWLGIAMLLTSVCVQARPLSSGRVALELPFEGQLAPGMFLVASRRLRAPSFAQTVILLIAYDEEGAQGVIINRPSPIRVSKVFPDLSRSPSPPIYMGGPVAQTQLRLLVRTREPSEGMQQVLEDVYLSGSSDVLKQLITSGSETPFRTFVGYAGWAPGQLEREVERGGWHIMPAEADAIFDAAPASVWPRLVSRRELKQL